VSSLGFQLTFDGKEIPHEEVVMKMQMAKHSADWTEKEWDTVLFQRAHGLAWQLGWTLNYHTYRSTRSPSGFPDRVIVRERVIYAELKKERGKPTAAQSEWLTGLTKAGAEVYLWLPHDLEEIAKILALRYDPLHPPIGKDKMIPRSRWHADGERMEVLFPELKGLVA